MATVTGPDVRGSLAASAPDLPDVDTPDGDKPDVDIPDVVRAPAGHLGTDPGELPVVRRNYPGYGHANVQVALTPCSARGRWWVASSA